MPRQSPAGLLSVAAVIAAVASGCGPKRVAAPQPARPTPTLIVLLPDPGTGNTGRARVTNEFGSANLAAPRASTLVSADAAPGTVETISDAEVARVFSGVLAALPPAPQHFTLYFRFESDTLTDESAALVSQIATAVKALAVPEVAVVGHTDTMGDPKANVALGLKRAASVRNILVAAGIEASMIEISSHGEADLLIKTGNNAPEPRNRRVEISVR
jgi:outer membrane protein OmpA-like peptidoglycan-associated protein